MSQIISYNSVDAVETITGNIGGAVSPDGLHNLNIVGSGDITVTGNPGTSTLTISASGAVSNSFPTDAGTATPALGALTIAGGTNIGTTGAGSTVTVNLDSTLTSITSITGSNGASLQTGTTAGNTLLLSAYNNTTSLYNTFATLTANLVPTFDLATGTTIAGNYIYRATGTDVPVTDGGTGVSTLTSHGILMGNGASAIQATAEPTDGQLLIGKTGNFPVLASLTAGAGISVTPGAGTITIANTSSGFTWTVTTIDAAAVAGNGYIANKAGLLTMTLPATGAIGDIIEISNMNTAIGWRIAQNANQFIRFGTSLTTTGIAGYLEATQLGDSVKLVCKISGASTGWQVISSIGNITVA